LVPSSPSISTKLKWRIRIPRFYRRYQAPVLDRERGLLLYSLDQEKVSGPLASNTALQRAAVSRTQLIDELIDELGLIVHQDL